MASKKTEYGSVKRFGPRYGRTLKRKTGKIEQMKNASYECPACHYKKVHRETKGVWLCDKCGAKFSSKAYTVAKMPLLKSVEKEA